MITRAQLEAWATSKGWSKDRWGHWRKGDYRLKLSKIAVRYETRSGAGWVRIRSQYYHSVSITPEGKLAGLTSYGCQPAEDNGPRVADAPELDGQAPVREI